MEKKGQHHNLAHKTIQVLHLLGSCSDIGGILTVIRAISLYGKNTGCTHTVYVNRSYKEKRTPSLNYSYGRFMIDESPSYIKLVIRGLLEIPFLKKIVKDFDIIHGHSRGSLLPGLILALTGKPFLFTNHAYAKNKKLYHILLIPSKVRMVLLTPQMSHYYGINATHGKVDIIPECCLPIFFESTLHRSIELSKNQPLRMIGIGTIEYRKRWHLIIQALSMLRPELLQKVRFVHYGPIGEGTYFDLLKNLLKKISLPETVCFYGPTTQVREMLNEADLFILPSTNEPCSVALIEALALGMPVIATRSGGNIDIIKDGQTGLLFDPDNPHALKKTIETVLLGEINFLSPKQIRETVLEFHPAAVASRYQKIYLQLIT